MVLCINLNLHEKKFAFMKQTFAQTYYNIYEFMILLNNVGQVFCHSRKICTKKSFTRKPFEGKDDTKLHSYIGFC